MFKPSRSLPPATTHQSERPPQGALSAKERITLLSQAMAMTGRTTGSMAFQPPRYLDDLVTSLQSNSRGIREEINGGGGEEEEEFDGSSRMVVGGGAEARAEGIVNLRDGLREVEGENAASYSYC